MDAVRSLESYVLKLKAERVKEDFTTRKPRMLSYLETAFGSLANMQNQVTAVLAAHDISTANYPSYRAFAGSLWRLVHKFGGGLGVIAEANLQIAKWRSRGCDETTLIAIRNDVFNIPAPPA